MVEYIRNFFRSNVAEIRADPALRFYGAALALNHVLTFHFWRGLPLPAAIILSEREQPVCWPFFLDCFRYRFFSPESVKAILFLYLFLSLVTVFFFLKRNSTVIAYALLSVVQLFQVILLVQDLRLRQNHHYMNLAVTLAFLCLREKRNLVRVLLVFFYVVAGTLKLNHSWLSGAILYQTPGWFPVEHLPALCTYVVILELFFVWGLLSQRKRLFWPAFAQLVLFHLSSWPIVGFFYPLLMFNLLSIFILGRHFASPIASPSFLLPRSTYAVLTIFLFLQCLPYFYPKPSTLRGEGRLASLYMFHERIDCNATTTIRYRTGRKETADLTVGFLLERIKCEPIVYFNLARNRCRSLLANPDFLDLDLFLESKSSVDVAPRQILNLKSFCSSPPKYNLFATNKWILR